MLSRRSILAGIAASLAGTSALASDGRLVAPMAPAAPPLEVGTYVLTAKKFAFKSASFQIMTPGGKILNAGRLDNFQIRVSAPDCRGDRLVHGESFAFKVAK